MRARAGTARRAAPQTRRAEVGQVGRPGRGVLAGCRCGPEVRGGQSGIRNLGGEGLESCSLASHLLNESPTQPEGHPAASLGILPQLPFTRQAAPPATVQVLSVQSRASGAHWFACDGASMYGVELLQLSYQFPSQTPE